MLRQRKRDLGDCGRGGFAGFAAMRVWFGGLEFPVGSARGPSSAYFLFRCFGAVCSCPRCRYVRAMLGAFRLSFVRPDGRSASVLMARLALVLGRRSLDRLSGFLDTKSAIATVAQVVTVGCSRSMLHDQARLDRA
jgi:hypothetical protein